MSATSDQDQGCEAVSAMVAESQRGVYAHTLAGKPADDWEPLVKHLEEVAASALEFAESFGGAGWADIIGRCHDLGKASKEFQDYLRRAASDSADAGIENAGAGRVDHSTYGARYVARNIAGPAGQLMAFCIAGHHAGLPDESSDDEAKQGGTLRRRLDDSVWIPEVEDPKLTLSPHSLQLNRGKDDAFQLAFFTRMLFSCLVDADRLCTEAFCSPATAAERMQSRPPLQELKLCLDRFLESKAAHSPDSLVNRWRKQILAFCRDAALLPSGFFSLNIPTSGGKTLSSLSFALDHALHNRLRRVVFAIPFTSIIEQTADVYRESIGAHANAVVEHHTISLIGEESPAPKWAAMFPI